MVTSYFKLLKKINNKIIPTHNQTARNITIGNKTKSFDGRAM